ncbi:helix-turn-helix domain-containing protein, partial [Faecalitalea cylindroides]
MVINNGIKEAREKKMMTQNDLAKRMGVDVNVIKDWEENNTMISLKDV